MSLLKLISTNHTRVSFLHVFKAHTSLMRIGER